MTDGFTQEQLAQLSRLIQTQTQHLTTNGSQDIGMSSVNAALARLQQIHLTDYSSSATDTCISKPLNFNIWIIDTRASCHIANSMHDFNNFKTVDNWYVLLPNNLKLKTTHKKEIHFNDSFILVDVLYVPTFTYNLLSVTKLATTLNGEVVFSAKCYVIKECLTKRRIGSAEESNGLYLDISDFTYAKKYSSCSNSVFFFKM